MKQIEIDLAEFLAKATENTMHVHALALCVFNKHNTLFNDLDFETILKQVDRVLKFHAANVGMLFEKGTKRGYYKLNKFSPLANQLMMDFQCAMAEEEDPPKVEEADGQLFFDL